MSEHSKKEPVPQTELKARALELSHVPAAAEKGRDTGLLIIKLGREWYGIPAPLALEIVVGPRIAPLPLTPAFVAGIINLHGELVAAIDLASLLGLPRPEGGAAYAVAVRRGDMTVAFLAELVSDVEWFASADLEPVLPTLPEEYAHFFAGAFRSGDRLITELNVEGILAHPRFDGSGGAGREDNL